MPKDRGGYSVLVSWHCLFNELFISILIKIDNTVLNKNRKQSRIDWSLSTTLNEKREWILFKSPILKKQISYSVHGPLKSFWFWTKSWKGPALPLNMVPLRTIKSWLEAYWNHSWMSLLSKNELLQLSFRYCEQRNGKTVEVIVIVSSYSTNFATF